MQSVAAMSSPPRQNASPGRRSSSMGPPSASRAQPGEDFKRDMREGQPKLGVFLSSGSMVVAELLAHAGYDWLLVDTQHSPTGREALAAMLCGIDSGGAMPFVRVGSFDDRAGIQMALDLGARGILAPKVNTAEEARAVVDAARYPMEGSRSVYFPERCMAKEGLLGYVKNANRNVIVAIQIETAMGVENVEEIAAVPGVDMLLLGQNDLCMSMGLYEKYEFPLMYTSKELTDAADRIVAAARSRNIGLGVFLFGTDRVKEYIERGYTFMCVGNDLHHMVTQAQTYVGNVERAVPGYKRRYHTDDGGP